MLATRVRAWVEEGAADWGLSTRAIWVMLTLPFAIAATGPIAALMGRAAYRWLTDDDSILENLQLVFFVLAAVVAFMVAVRLIDRSERVLAGLYVLVGLALVFLIGEEVSWGQRIFGWGTPDVLDDINKQGETNVHNVYGVRHIFKWAYLVIGAYGLFAPIWIRSSAADPHRERLAWVVPHFTLIPYFALLVPWRLYRNLVPTPESAYVVVSEYNEVLELNLALGFALFMWFQLRRTVREGALGLAA